MRLLITYSLGMATLAGLCAYIIAYEQVSRRGGSRYARRYALGAVPGPFLFFTGLGIVLGWAVPTVIHL
jgi:uncharacterized protein YqgC (DUF456 family)